MKMPRSLRAVMDVPSNTAEMIKTNTGLMVMMMDALTGLVTFNPLKNSSWLAATPVVPQASSRKKSPRSMDSQVPRARIAARTNQKSPPPPITRNTMNPLGPTKSGIRPLATK